MASAKDSFLDLERHRQKLEENVGKLSKALDHWKQWKQEYEALRTDVKSLSQSASREELSATREKFQGELLNDKELIDIFGRSDSKKAEQIISTLTNRLDYVTKNIDTLTKQLEEAKNKLAAVTVVANPDAIDEEGLPITEIFEELDDDDNVVSYSLRRPGDNQPQIIEALKKAGITDLSPAPRTAPLPDALQEREDGESRSSKDAQRPSTQQPKNSKGNGVSKSAPSLSAQKPTKSEFEEKPKAKPLAKKKSVSFAEDTKSGKEQEQSETVKRLEEILQKARDQQSITSDPILPADESPEDAALREDMIRYNKDTMEFEMAPIVAELQLEEGSTGDDTDDYSNYEDEDDDDEDQWGKSKLSLDDDWKRQMLELKERLSSRTFGEDKALDNDEDMVEGFGRVSIKREGKDDATGHVESAPAAEPEMEELVPIKNTKKSVRFAQSLDIAEDPAPAPQPVPQKQSAQPEVDPVADVVMERNGARPRPVATPSNKRTSRFRKDRSNELPVGMKVPTFNGTPIAPEKPVVHARTTPTGPEGQTLATSVLEHAPSLEVKEPDEFDAELLHKQVAEEYYKVRNKLVHRQGGFMKEDENPIQPLDEEEGGPKRMSRFKAARLAR
ncbi:Prefoldin subunit-domain-containing protein [Hypoxylon crocopeplum]|nr:Prefoldin subunit-domain-containing protein [Hypoxylon crocopeplum]